MVITEIIVPKGVRYINQWDEFGLKEFPHIIDKQIPGCGFTEYCITNSMDIILVCPRKMLLENKESQHKGEVFYARSEIFQELSVDKNLVGRNLITSKSASNQFLEKDENARRTLAERAARERDFLKRELESYWFVKQAEKKPAKILVTYDSFRKIREILEELKIFREFYIVIDEFQSIFVDSRFKSDTELEFVNALKDVNRVCYVSATPMIESYLDKLDEFKDLPYFKFNWSKADPSRVSKPGLTIRALSSVNQVASKIIDSYKSGKFETSIRINKEDGSKEIVESKEAVIFVNSVNNIISIIKKCKLLPEECNILCANNTDNQNRISSKLGKEYLIGTIPLKGEKHKMFTFCTRTVYLGSDFYSDNARSFIISDANKETLSVDISLDLPQILGRQRLESNPWKNQATIYIRTFNKEKISQKDFDDYINAKIENTKRLLNIYETAEDGVDRHLLAMKFLDSVLTRNYTDDYVAVNKHGGKDLLPTFNKLILISEQRAYDIQQTDYADRFTVFNRLEEVFGEINTVGKSVDEVLADINSLDTYLKKLKYLCTINISKATMNSVLNSLSENLRTAYLMLGPERCRACGYDHAKITREIDIITYDVSEISKKVNKIFIIGNRYSSKNIKSSLSELYKESNYKNTPKATDLEEWFEVKEVKVKDSSGKWDRGYEIIKKK